MRFTSAQLFSLANEIAHALGTKDPHGVPLQIQAPADERALVALRRSLQTALHAVRPVSRAPAVGEVLTTLLERPRRRAGEGRNPIRRLLAELDQLVTVAAFGRSKRAERARLLAVLLVLFDLDVALGFATDDDLEATLRLTRRGIEETLRSAR